MFVLKLYVHSNLVTRFINFYVLISHCPTFFLKRAAVLLWIKGVRGCAIVYGLGDIQFIILLLPPPSCSVCPSVPPPWLFIPSTRNQCAVKPVRHAASPRQSDRCRRRTRKKEEGKMSTWRIAWSGGAQYESHCWCSKPPPVSTETSASIGNSVKPIVDCDKVHAANTTWNFKTRVYCSCKKMN